MSPASYQLLVEIVLGFCLAAVLANAYQVLLRRPPSYRLLGMGYGRTTFLAMPFVTFAAPFIMMRNVLRRAGRTGRFAAELRFSLTMMTTVIAGMWSLFSGSLILSALRVLGIEAI